MYYFNVVKNIGYVYINIWIVLFFLTNLQLFCINGAKIMNTSSYQKLEQQFRNNNYESYDSQSNDDIYDVKPQIYRAGYFKLFEYSPYL